MQKIKNLIIKLLPDVYIISYNSKMKKRIEKNRQWFSVPESKYPEILKNVYYKKIGRELNLDEPKAYTEKVQWLKLHDSTPEKTAFADKYKAKELASDIIGKEHIIEAYGKWNSFDEIDFDKLPDSFVLKTNHGSGNVIVVKNKKKFLHSSQYRIAKSRFNVWMQINYAFDDTLELHYKDITPCIFAERYLDSAMDEYRFLCFNGEPYYCYTEKQAEDHQYIRNVYDMDWNLVECNFGRNSVNGKTENKPPLFEQMKSAARELSKGFTHVRADFYNTGDNFYFGEMTFTSGSGFTYIEPESFDLKLGSLMPQIGKSEEE